MQRASRDPNVVPLHSPARVSLMVVANSPAVPGSGQRHDAVPSLGPSMTCGHFALAAALIRSELKASLISPNRPRAGMFVRRIRPEPEPPNVKNDGGLWLEYGVGGGMVNRPPRPSGALSDLCTGGRKFLPNFCVILLTSIRGRTYIRPVGRAARL
jgi:hypothetical protein